MADHTDPPFAPGLARPHPGGRALDRDSPRGEFEATLHRLGYDALSALDLENAWDAFREVAATKAEVTVRDLKALLGDRLRAEAEQYQLLRMSTITRTGERAWARVELLERGVEMPLEAEGTGDGPIHAALNAVIEALGVTAQLVSFRVEALSTGADALAEAHLTVEVGGRQQTAEGVAPSLTEAGVRAFLHALSQARRSDRRAG
jgi:2-isopropylmalate synthase